MRVALSMRHFRALFKLEEEYSYTRRRLIEGFGEAHAINQQLCQTLRDTVVHHDRNTLSKNLAPGLSVFSSLLPSILLNTPQL